MLSSITIKRNNHWLYHCESANKQEMLTKLISYYANKSILIAVSNKNNLSLEGAENITIMSDDEIMVADEQKFDLIIHADLPAQASHYIKRLSCAKELSIGLLFQDESQLLYQIETLLGRTITQKYLEGFEAVKTVQKEFPKQTEHTSKNHSQETQKPRYEKKKFGKPSDTTKPRQRNHHKDGTLRTDEERAEYHSRRTESGMKKKAEQDKKPFTNKKKYDKKEPFNKKGNFENKKNDRNSENKFAQPKRKPRVFKLKVSKKDGDK
ncbi:hypothetical protein [Sulfurimonas sp.]|uniref:hypothetical protein n=1 Tax=Sulfurimonas sp. TaxID=2022749 RepID=UPI003565D9E8